MSDRLCGPVYLKCQNDCLGVSVPRVRPTVWTCVFEISERLCGRVSDVRITMWTCACVMQVRERLCERGMPVAMWDNKYVEVYNYVCCGCENDYVDVYMLVAGVRTTIYGREYFMSVACARTTI